MKIDVPSPMQVAGLMGMPFAGAAIPISDTTRDPGLFGPGSVTWKVQREPLLVLGGPRALLMQVAHPLVAEGALQHSVFEEDPFGRLLRTAAWVARVVYGTRAEADAACREINMVHAKVEGELTEADATSRLAAGTKYRARDPELARWVHATLVDTLLATYETLVRPLPQAEQDQFVREWNAVARRVGVRPSGCFNSRKELTDYITAQINGGPVLCGAGSLQVAETILTSPVALAKPAWPALLFLSIALLPEPLRSQYGQPWSRSREAAFRMMRRAARVQRRTVPTALRTSATAEFAARRARGELDQRGIA